MSKASKRVAKSTAKFSTEENKGETSAMSSASTLSSTVCFSEEFSPGRFLIYSHFADREWVHIREYVTLREKTYPTKKGVCLTPSRLKSLTNKLDEIDEQLKQASSSASYKVEQSLYKSHLGAGIYASVGSEFKGVDLRRYWVPEEQMLPIPTRNGIFLSLAQWNSLKQKIPKLLAAHPELNSAEECFHANQMGYIDCKECMPFGWIIESFNGSQ